jgi:hypothetical protein
MEEVKREEEIWKKGREKRVLSQELTLGYNRTKP